MPYVWEQLGWPALRYVAAAVAKPLADVSVQLGRLHGRMADQAQLARDRATLLALTDDAMETSAIEGEILDYDSVRSSLARRLGIDGEGLAKQDRKAEGVVAMLLDATTNAAAPLTAERLKGWQAALFPTGFSVIHPVRAGQWRDDHDGPMQVVSGRMGRRRVHFEAPPATRLEHEVDAFLAWFEHDDREPWVIKAALAHLWFVTLHPFEDGNGRLARAIGDLALARAEGLPDRYYSVSSQIMRERAAYYDVLETTQKGDLDVTPWVLWFLNCVSGALTRAEDTLDGVLAKARFWAHANELQLDLNPRQTRMLNLVLDGMHAPLTNRKYAKLAQVSSDTALRDLRDLVDRQVLTVSGTGKSTVYSVSGPVQPPTKSSSP